jgi:hypothetical protein
MFQEINLYKDIPPTDHLFSYDNWYKNGAKKILVLFEDMVCEAI